MGMMGGPPMLKKSMSENPASNDSTIAQSVEKQKEDLYSSTSALDKMNHGTLRNRARGPGLCYLFSLHVLFYFFAQFFII